MDAEMLVGRVLDDEALTDGLFDPEAKQLIEWMVSQVEAICQRTENAAAASTCVESLCRRARGIRRFLTLWCHRHDHAAATQFVATERYGWPLPTSETEDPCEILQPILDWEASQAQS